MKAMVRWFLGLWTIYLLMKLMNLILTETGNATAIKFAVQGLYSQYNNAMGVNQT